MRHSRSSDADGLRRQSRSTPFVDSESPVSYGILPGRRRRAL